MFFQIGEAIYIYVKFQSNTALNAMAIPLFIGGVLKYLERIWALRCANPKQLMKYFYSAPKTENLSSSDSVRSEMREMIRTGLFDPSKKRDFIGNSMITSDVRFLREVDSACDVFKPLFTDLSFQISKEFHDEMVYLNPSTRTAAEAFNFVEIELEFLYDLLYTKNPIQHRHHIVSLAVEFSSHARHAKVAMQGEVAASSRVMKCRNWSLKLPNYLLCFDCIFNYYFVI
ncbi:hypothetical protein ES288_A03G251900v1 [Gossypium darwinii]|uniref:DUF4220 domain-containing protein n=1 Tax=Gossypium darwinii TaxID=34276 RepID=A0A5D2H7R0_GOSDA|nr:hypothetical protein ES288_A03G251900v1 [Gossypium darwinii]